MENIIKNEELNQEINDSLLVDDTEVEQEVLQNQLEKSQKNLKRDQSFYRARIDRLMSRPDIRYKAPLSYRTLRIIGFLLLFLSQAYIAFNMVSSHIEHYPAWIDELFIIFEIVSTFALPVFLASNFCVIMSDKKSIVKKLIIYSVCALLIYVCILLIYYRYIFGIIDAILDDPTTSRETAYNLTNLLFGKIINYNIFIDLSLFCLFYLFFFYTPKKIKTKKGLIAFRSLSILPIIIVIVSAILYSLHYKNVITLPIAILAIMPCRSLTFYAIFIILSFVIKLRQYKFLSWGGTQEEYRNYLATRRNSLEISSLASIIIAVISFIDLLFYLFVPEVILYGIGYNFYLCAIIPLLFLLDYKKKPKHPIIDILIPIIFIACVIIMFCEAALLSTQLIFK